jgi:hypothetical protein
MTLEPPGVALRTRNGRECSVDSLELAEIAGALGKRQVTIDGELDHLRPRDHGRPDSARLYMPGGRFDHPAPSGSAPRPRGRAGEHRSHQAVAAALPARSRGVALGRIGWDQDRDSSGGEFVHLVPMPVAGIGEHGIALAGDPGPLTSSARPPPAHPRAHREATPWWLTSRSAILSADAREPVARSRALRQARPHRRSVSGLAWSARRNAAEDEERHGEGQCLASAPRGAILNGPLAAVGTRRSSCALGNRNGARIPPGASRC